MREQILTPRFAELPASMRRTVWLLALLPAALLVPGVLLLVWYLSEPSWATIAAFMLWLAGDLSLIAILTLRLVEHEKQLRPTDRKLPEVRRTESIRMAVRYGGLMVAFGALYLGSIAAVVFGLWPLHESSAWGAIAMNLILLAVLVGVPIAFYLAVRALGIPGRWSGPYALAPDEEARPPPRK